ncbi:MAG: GWxTD domain-containing protein, partial [candidate division KSB1 bacterium]|nr:GWxTD domain-containing protein [candidate division KSB1 bacterium]
MLQFQTRAGKVARAERKKSWREEFMLYKTRRYRLYEALYERYYADDHEWSLEELVDYGLFHIVPQDEFEQYLALGDPYDRQEWRRIFWKAYDPTPTTPENEFKEEFMRRVIKARAEYGEEWNYRHFRYLRNQYLRSGWSWSPWDSRGELLVKLGEPDYTEPVALNVDVWYYSREGVSFGVNRYVTNIYGNGYYPDGLYAFIHVGGPGAIEVDYIYNHLMVYDPLPGIKRIKGIRLVPRPISDNRFEVRIDVPRKRLALIRQDGSRWRIDYLRRLVVFDLDYREVL